MCFLFKEGLASRKAAGRENKHTKWWKLVFKDILHQLSVHNRERSMWQLINCILRLQRHPNTFGRNWFQWQIAGLWQELLLWPDRVIRLVAPLCDSTCHVLYQENLILLQSGVDSDSMRAELTGSWAARHCQWDRWTIVSLCCFIWGSSELFRSSLQKVGWS